MNLYYWPEVECLRCYTDGYAIAMAETQDEAIEVLVRQHLKERWNGYPELLRDELNRKEPHVYSEPHGILIEGSD